MQICANDDFSTRYVLDIQILKKCIMTFASKYSQNSKTPDDGTIDDTWFLHVLHAIFVTIDFSTCTSSSMFSCVFPRPN